MPAKNNIFKQLSKVFLVLDQTTSPGSTTLTAAAAAGATALTVAAITNFANGDVIRVGSGEEMELAIISGAPSGNTINVAAPGLVYAHVIGEAVVEMVAYDLGDIEEAGFTIDFAGESTDVQSATRRLAFANLAGYVDAACEFSLPTFTIPNFAIAVGAALSGIRGTGTAGDPLEFTSDGNEFGQVANAAVVAVGTKFDGTYLRAELWGVDFDYSGVTFGLSRGQLTAVPVRAVASAGGIFATTNYSFTPSTSLVASKGKVFDAITEAGYFDITVTTTTVNGNVAAGATSITLTSGTNFADGDWILVGSGDTAQLIWLGTKSTNTFSPNRTRPFRAIATGATVTKVTPTRLAGIAPAGPQLNLGGTVTPMRIAERRLSIGARAGAATAALAIPTVDLSLANIARMLGIPQSVIANNRLPWNQNIGTAGVEGLYVKGTLKDGTIAWVIAAGNDIDVSQVSLTLNNSGEAPAGTITGKPSSYIQFLQHA